MINRNLTSSFVRSNVLQGTARATQKPDMLTRFMKNHWVGKVCDTAADNPVICQSLFSLGICCAARPVTNYATTPNKKDAGYASCHSISSGLVGWVWPFIFATPLAAAVGLITKNPAKYLKPEVIKKFYPSVGIEEVMENGKKIKRVMTNAKGKMLRENGTEILTELEPLKIKNGDCKSRLKDVEKKLSKTKNQDKIARLNEEKAILEDKLAKFEQEKTKFETENPGLYVDKTGIVRSRTVFKTKNGKYQLDETGEKSANGKIGEKMGCVVQEDKTPITEEVENGINKEQNVAAFFKWLPDIMLAPPRAILTIKLIPALLGVLGIEKDKKVPAKQNDVSCAQKTQTAISKPSTISHRASIFSGMQTNFVSSNKKGGV